jgi:hypothetical protein
MFGGLQAGDAGKATIAAQLPSPSEFGGGAFGLTFEGIGGSELGANVRMCRSGVARLSEPDDCLVRARLQQMLIGSKPGPHVIQF